MRFEVQSAIRVFVRIEVVIFGLKFCVDAGAGLGVELLFRFEREKCVSAALWRSGKFRLFVL
jgi:hypothetical protein